MPSNYMAPGIYVEEVSGGARPIEAVGTSTAGFVGAAPNKGAFLNQARAVNNWSQFARDYVGEATESTPLSAAVFGFFENGGSRCYVVNVGPGNPLVGKPGTRTGLDLLEQIDEIAIVAAPGYTSAGDYDAVLKHCEKMEDRVAILDAPPEVDDPMRLKETAVEGESGEDGPSKGLGPRASEYGAFYFPWLRVRNELAPSESHMVPPSGHVAGIWARTDATRGVHKAPANEAVRGALNLSYHLTRAELGELNQAGVNCIRFFAREGIRVWGARTISGDPEWRYLNVRRLFNMIKESIAENTRWIVFEPNDNTLWKSIRRDIGAFLTGLWRDGALMGSTPEEAFFVKCDAETNPPDSIDRGIVVTVIGIAPVKPAEFIVFRISQHQSGTDTETQGGS